MHALAFALARTKMSLSALLPPARTTHSSARATAQAVTSNRFFLLKRADLVLGDTHLLRRKCNIF